MKQYMISKEELRELGRVIYNIGYDRNSNREVKIEMEDFLKSKKPVRLVASGRIYYLKEEIDIGVGNMEHLEYGFNGLTQEIAKENESCPAQLFVEEE